MHHSSQNVNYTVFGNVQKECYKPLNGEIYWEVFYFIGNFDEIPCEIKKTMGGIHCGGENSVL